MILFFKTWYMYILVFKKKKKALFFFILCLLNTFFLKSFEDFQVVIYSSVGIESKSKYICITILQHQEEMEK